MKKILSFFREHYLLIYKYFLFTVTVLILLSFFPKNLKFKYEFQKGKPWQHEDLIAPFDFAILKSDAEIKVEKKEILKNLHPYFKYIKDTSDQNKNKLIKNFNLKWDEKYPNKDSNNYLKNLNREVCVSIYDTILSKGIIEVHKTIENKPDDYNINILKNNVAEKKELKDLFTIHSANIYIQKVLKEHDNIDVTLLTRLLTNCIIQNVKYDENLTLKAKQAALNKISLSHGMIQKGEKIISKGDIISNNKFQILYSLKKDYENQIGNSSDYHLILTGQIILVLIIITVFILFLLFFRKDIFYSNKKLILILFTIILTVFMTKITVKYNPSLIYLVPICLVPIVIRSFFDTNLALFVTIITIVLIGLIVPNSFEFIFLQLITGIVTILSIVKLQNRSQFFLTSVLIFLSYSLIYTALSLIQQGNFEDIKYINYGLFAISSILTLFSYPLIFLYEKLFGFITDVTLMELSDSNSKLLRQLSMKAPGTFQHSLQVSNLAEEAIYKIGGNSLLIRTGALYHDIGKMDMPMYFIENQSSGTNPHDDHTYAESAKIIISHVIKGIEMAKKYKLPEKIIDFIRTHHGTRKVEYFYTLQKKYFPDEPINEDDFSYNGLLPFSKETAILMMADSVEAASRSIKEPDEQKINDLVDNIIDKQIQEKQFINSDITFKDITKVKNVFKKRLLNIHHIRIEYPE
ncbi:MAG: HDIG domain-containing protein [Bacteroidales bacterium]|nr:HDIG domain-containing protein [Bacteroidales bacterium]